MDYQQKPSSSAYTHPLRRGVRHNPYRQGCGYGNTFRFKTESMNILVDKKQTDKPGREDTLTATAEDHTTNIYMTDIVLEQKSPTGVHSPRATPGSPTTTSVVQYVTAAPATDEDKATSLKDKPAIAANDISSKEKPTDDHEDDEWTVVRQECDDDWTVIIGVA
ncbi:hypothetical protein GE09DRAFT_1052425 [Coniochaeta sp. 2T2.1]|nr:hypothetical protein GE09DRAFT_1052425 [Coniochaeta sp. 2T2.1]